ncbi:MAG: septal ring lytic transglycosylase RlpA family lipoprotein [Gammaproteobacteria bacterium CG_4_10_14_0_8_um_filter_38_16]|nr:MAG: septal ring lytic transglycosylase RlpA family lipoprotein [Gammaproteobacteria bacterium CG_4_10_14_0_8_um_filter_38_16]PJA03051.1 MAG: septal ring lytic transglycosylase RlpA family lipoprotein [Gammaproteobacteria bacterium CG_4_10_14_0_2_um_filter_38_22]PJB10219.1 MAG: septal ring lytic transglycosylase RlpA family lipoprotein [Gammaproteobacteria bacterium CG_4_9_14_3_um_filter_38_9]
MDSPKPPETPRCPAAYFYILFIFLFIFTVGGCFHRPAQDGPPDFHVNVSKIHNPVPHYLPKSKYGNPNYYWVDGRRYHVLKSAKGYDKRGIASWYGTKFNGRLTSTREKYNLLGMTAASPDLPIPCFVRVTNLENGKQVIVKVNDRGPFAANRIMDLSYVAAKKLGYIGRGTALVEVTSIDVPNPLEKTRRIFAHHHPQMYLQVGAFEYPQNATRLEVALKHLTSRAIRVTHHAKESRLYRVQIGPLQTVSESDMLQARIERAGLGHAITVIG